MTVSAASRASRARGVWLPAAVLGIAAVLTLAPGCRKRGPDGPMPLCEAQVAGDQAVEAKAQELPPEVWFSILIDGFDRDRMLAGDEPSDCTGRSVIAPTLPSPQLEPGETAPEEPEGTVAGCPVGADPNEGRLPARPLTDEDLIISAGPDGKTLVWVQTVHYQSGEATGPVALVEWTQIGVAVRALGTLRAQTNKARMRIERAAGMDVLVVEGDECNIADSKLCRRIMRLLPIINDRFSTVPLKRAEGDCLGDATFSLFDQYSSLLPDGWTRQFQVVRSVDFEGEYPVIAEQVTIRDSDPEQPEAPPQEFRQASSDRALVYKDRYFETEPTLWER